MVKLISVKEVLLSFFLVNLHSETKHKRATMKIALIGYGKMGHAVEAEALRRGHEVVCAIDSEADWAGAAQWSAAKPDVAVEFSTPATAVDNIRRCWAAGVKVVCGTTGWTAQADALRDECMRGGHTLLASSNFSIGMNIMFAVNERLARLMAGRDYRVSISETHHVHKLDAPSGTALTLAGQIAACGGRRLEDIQIESIRQGEVPGTHSVVYDSAVDTLTVTHEAHNRAGLAQGAVAAAEFAACHSGWLTMNDMLGL